MKLEDIGFYTLSEERAKNCDPYYSPIARCEILLTDKCNMHCVYCRGVKEDIRGTLSFDNAWKYLQLMFKNGLRNIRFSGGEPTLYRDLPWLVALCKRSNVQHIAISTNGTSSLKYYKFLHSLGANDFSISLDGACCAVVNKMIGAKDNTCSETFEHVSNVIKELSKITYVTVGCVINEYNRETISDTIKYIDSLGPSDIRIIPSAQYGTFLDISHIPKKILDKYPILRYRVQNFRDGLSIRGIGKDDTKKCPLVLDDVAIAGKYHFPCIIYLREKGNPVGEVGEDIREQRMEWYLKHDAHKDEICQKNCLDVCVQHNNRVEYYGTRET